MAGRLLLCALAGLAGCATPPGAALLVRPPADRVASAQCVPAWHPHALPGKRPTRYDVGSEAGDAVVRARADRSASMLRFPWRVEPAALSTLHFSWRVSSLIAGADISRRDAEDAPVRVVLAFDGDHEALPPREQALFELMQMLTGERPPYATLMYAWDTRAPQESVVVHPRSDRIRTIVVDSGPDQLARWREHRRDIVADYRRAFGEAPGALVGLALMTDADNTGSATVAWYGAVCLAAPVSGAAGPGEASGGSLDASSLSPAP